jgi:hypothetical protein
MSQYTDPKEIEHRASLYHGDGLLDIFIGLAILLAGAAGVLDRTSFGAIWIVLWLPMMKAAKKSITVPRMRTIDFMPAPGARRRVKRGIVIAVLSLAVMMTLGLVLFTKNGALPLRLTTWAKEYARVIWPAFLVGIGALIAFATGVRRLYGYTLLAVITIAVSYWLNLGFPLHIFLTVLGAIILLSGMVILVRFLRKYPIALDTQLQAADRRAG